MGTQRVNKRAICVGLPRLDAEHTEDEMGRVCGQLDHAARDRARWLLLFAGIDRCTQGITSLGSSRAARAASVP
jgi:hypothetical protein